jgi:two-component system, NarL family, nitrate/nitrite response regulator NarL
VRVLLVEDHEMVASGITALLHAEPDLEVGAWVRTGADALGAYQRDRPDAVLMDYSLPDASGTDVTAQLRDHDPTACVLIVTGHEATPRVVLEALDVGCAGFVSKERSVTDLANAIRAAVNGAAVFPADLLAMVARRNNTGGGNSLGELTPREREVLDLLAQGRSTDEIQARLFLSQHTVRNHVRNVLNKLQARTKLEAVVIAARAGLVDLRPQA